MFAHALAHELGYFDVDAMLASGQAGTLDRWGQFYLQRDENPKALTANDDDLDAMTGI